MKQQSRFCRQEWSGCWNFASTSMAISHGYIMLKFKKHSTDMRKARLISDRSFHLRSWSHWTVTFVLSSSCLQSITKNKLRKWKHFQDRNIILMTRWSIERFMHSGSGCDTSSVTPTVVTKTDYVQLNHEKVNQYSILRGCLRGKLLIRFSKKIISVINQRVNE